MVTQEVKVDIQLYSLRTTLCPGHCEVFEPKDCHANDNSMHRQAVLLKGTLNYSRCNPISLPITLRGLCSIRPRLQTENLRYRKSYHELE